MDPLMFSAVGRCTHILFWKVPSDLYICVCVCVCVCLEARVGVETKVQEDELESQQERCDEGINKL